ncbi:MAG: site-specific recombinase [Patescibacteria group bacterium]|nr:site-specific recombinase [Patescibacteria group bacterium]
MRTAVIYTRVSSKEQVDGYSLENQLKDCQAYAEGKGLLVQAVFVEEGESAKTDQRSQFQKMILHSIKHRRDLDVVIVWKLDRFARNAGDHFAVRKLLAGYGVKLRSATEQIDETPTGKLIEGTLAIFAEFDNDIRSLRCSAGMTASVEEGCWPFSPPTGYRAVKDPQKRATLEPNEQAGLVKKLLLEFRTGKYTQKDAAKLAASIGLVGRTGKPFTQQTICNMLRNPIYAGIVRSSMVDGDVDGIHPPLISVGDHKAIQAILSGRKKAITPYAKRNEHWPLRGKALRCGDCDSSITGSAPRGSSGAYYMRYNCPKCRKSVTGKITSIANDVMHEQFEAQLAAATPTEGSLRLYREVVLRRWNQEYREAFERRKAIDRELDGIDATAITVTDMIVDNKLDAQMGRDKHQRLKRQREQLEEEKRELKNDEANKRQIVDMAIGFMADPVRFWREATVEDKQRFQKMVFPDGITYDFGNGFRTATLGLNFQLSADVAGDKSKMVATGRFELPTKSL